MTGFTGDQQFFLSFGQAWRSKTREATLRQHLVTDGHAPAEYRADTVRNMDAWYARVRRQGRRAVPRAADRAKIR